MMLEVRNLEVRYGAILGLRGISIEVKSGEIVALIGANGAGKSTTVRAIAGLLPFSGEIVYNGKKLKPGQAEKNLRAGIALVPEGRGILGRMTVEENLQMGVYSRSDWSAAARDIDAMYQRFPILGERRNSLASLLSGGEQQMLAIGRALMANPSLVLMDEPSEGLSPRLVLHVGEIMQRLRDYGLAVMLVEQNLSLALSVADDIYVLSSGRLVFHGSSEQLASDAATLNQHLGVGSKDLQ